MAGASLASVEAVDGGLELGDLREGGLEGGAHAEVVAVLDVNGQVGARTAPRAEDGARSAANVHGAAGGGVVVRLVGGQHADGLARRVRAAVDARCGHEVSEAGVVQNTYGRRT